MYIHGMWNEVVIVVIACIVIIVDALIAYVAFGIAKQKGYDDIGWAILLFLLPPIGYIFLIAMPDKTIQKQNERIIQLLEDTQKDVSKAKARRAVTYSSAVFNISEPWVCQHCGYTNEPNHLVCLNCGKSRQPEEQK